MFCGEEERVPDSVSGASDGESQDDYDLMESDCDEEYSELSAFCMWYIIYMWCKFIICGPYYGENTNIYKVHS